MCWARPDSRFGSAKDPDSEAPRISRNPSAARAAPLRRLLLRRRPLLQQQRKRLQSARPFRACLS
jgi:hypothetical protein